MPLTYLGFVSRVVSYPFCCSVFLLLLMQRKPSNDVLLCLVTYLDEKKKGWLELIVLIKRVILLKSEPAYKKIAIENQSGPLMPSSWQVPPLCPVLGAVAAGGTHPALHCALPDTPAVLKAFCMKLQQLPEMSMTSKSDEPSVWKRSQ